MKSVKDWITHVIARARDTRWMRSFPVYEIEKAEDHYQAMVASGCALPPVSSADGSPTSGQTAWIS